MSIFTMICVFYFGLKSNAIYDRYKKDAKFCMLIYSSFKRASYEIRFENSLIVFFFEL